MKTIWRYSLENEALRVIEEAYEISTGFFRERNFLVLPFEGNKYPCPYAVYFPDLPYYRIKRFWQRVINIEYHHTPVRADKTLVGEVLNLLKKSNFPTPDVSKTGKVWGGNQHAIIKEISRLLNLKKAVGQITFYPSVFGTRMSFNISSKLPADIKLFLRQDGTITTIVEGILSSLVKKDVFEKMGGSWHDSELLVDWLILKSSLNKIIAKIDHSCTFQGTVKEISKQQNGSLYTKSNRFLRKIGAPLNKADFCMKGKYVLSADKPLDFLTSRETKVFSELISNQGKVVNYDRLAEIIFKNEEDFSLYVISKLIQSIRDKLEKNHFPSCHIQAIRGEGYIFK